MAEQHRRGFLRQLAVLPMIGGGITLIGHPTAVAEPVTPDVLEAYKTFLHYEQRFLAWEMADDPACLARYRFDPGASRPARADVIESHIFEQFVGQSSNMHSHGTSTSRAALVLAAVGCDWRKRDAR